MRIFYEKNITCEGNLLPYSEFRLFRDFDELKPNPEHVKKIIEQAEKYLESDIPVLKASEYLLFFSKGDRTTYDGKFFKRRTMLTAFALAEHFERKGRFTEKLLDTVWAIMEESTWNIPAQLYTMPYRTTEKLSPCFDPATPHGIALFSVSTGMALTITYQFAKDILDEISPVICEKIEYMVRERILQPYLKYDFWWTGNVDPNDGRLHHVNNHTTWNTGNVLYMMSVFEKDDKVREAFVKKGMIGIDTFINSYGMDGGCEEGPSYWGVAGAALFDCLELLEDLSGGRINIFGEPLIRNIAEYIYKVNVNGKRFINFGDAPSNVGHSAVALNRYGVKWGSDSLIAFAKKHVKYHAEPRLLNYQSGYRSIKNIYSDTVTPDDTFEVATKSYLEDLQIMTLRETPNSEKGLFLAAKGGHNEVSHNHNDIGNFLVYHDGEPVIIDFGVGTYTKQTFSADRYKLWTMRSSYHNIPTFNGVEQKNGRCFEATNVKYDVADGSLEMELKNAYPDDAGIESYVRKCAMNGSKIIISERVRLTGEQEITFRIMTHVKPEIIEDGKVLLAQGRTISFDKALKCEIEEFFPEGMNAKTAWGSEMLYRVLFTVNAKNYDTDFIIE